MSKNRYEKRQNFQIFLIGGEKLVACIKNPKYTKVTGSFRALNFIRIMKFPQRIFQTLLETQLMKRTLVCFAILTVQLLHMLRQQIF